MNFMVSIKKFFTNKNVVTIIGVIAILILLYVGYNKTIESQVQPITVPVALQTIQPRTLITEDMVQYIEVSGGIAQFDNIVLDGDSIVGMYVDVNTVVPAGSMFYEDILVTKEELPDKAFVEVAEGERPYALSVDIDSTYGNSIFPGSVIDVYMKATDENGVVMVGRLLSKVKVLAVKDAEGEHVFENTEESRTPAVLLFGVPDDIFLLLKKAGYLGNFGVELFPVPYGGTEEIEADLAVDREELVDFIESNTYSFSGIGGSVESGEETENE